MEQLGFTVRAIFSKIISSGHQEDEAVGEMEYQKTKNCLRFIQNEEIQEGGQELIIPILQHMHRQMNNMQGQMTTMQGQISTMQGQMNDSEMDLKIGFNSRVLRGQDIIHLIKNPSGNHPTLQDNGQQIRTMTYNEFEELTSAQINLLVSFYGLVNIRPNSHENRFIALKNHLRIHLADVSIA